MIFDMQSLFSDAQAITATAASTNIIDLGAPGTPKHAKKAITQDIGRGRPVPMRVQVTQAFNTLTSLTIALQCDDNDAFSSPKTLFTATVLLVDLKAGYVLPLEYMPPGTNERFLRMYYTVAGSAPTTGKITAGLVAGNSAWSA